MGHTNFYQGYGGNGFKTDAEPESTGSYLTRPVDVFHRSFMETLFRFFRHHWSAGKVGGASCVEGECQVLTTLGCVTLIDYTDSVPDRESKETKKHSFRGALPVRLKRR